MNGELCQICRENYVSEIEAKVCTACARQQIRRLVVQCKVCGTYTIKGRETGDKLDLIDNLIDKGMADVSDLTHNGFGFILRIKECILCKSAKKNQ